RTAADGAPGGRSAEAADHETADDERGQRRASADRAGQLPEPARGGHPSHARILNAGSPLASSDLLAANGDNSIQTRRRAASQPNLDLARSLISGRIPAAASGRGWSGRIPAACPWAS